MGEREREREWEREWESESERERGGEGMEGMDGWNTANLNLSQQPKLKERKFKKTNFTKILNKYIKYRYKCANISKI